jgi:hypothetical protein
MAKVEAAAQAIAESLPDAFAGDAHALLMSVYKDTNQPLPIRLDAAKSAIGFEKPRLGSTNMTLDDKRSVEQFTDAELEAHIRASSAGAFETETREAESGQVH